MRLRSTLASGALFAATGALVLTTALAFPAVSLAQPYNESAAEQCEQEQNSRAVAGAVLGGVAGVLGADLSGDSTGGAVFGAAAGAEAGADAGASTATCQGDYQPAPPPGYDGGPNAYDNAPPPPGYAGGPPQGDGPNQNCDPAQRQITPPDDAEARHTVQACPDDGGH
ncbi:MAG TPA: hypothetical protein VE309_12515 [Caulobacteraceae bacterium]|jgi:hypothetical protein|nr:hypothetical protein [Caulobacteraceae bacterium]